MPRKYRVLVDDNFHYMDESERYMVGEFDTLEAAVAKCKGLVDEFLSSAHKPGMSASELLDQYSSFGEDPFIETKVGGVDGVLFSAHDYAAQRVPEICAGSS